MPKPLKIHLIILYSLLALSLLLNFLLLWQWWQFRRQALQVVQTVQPVVQQGLAQAVSDLQAFEQSTIHFDVALNQPVPVQAEIPLRQSLDVPIQTTVPIRQNIQTTVMIDPLGTGLTVPVDINAPIDLEVPIDTVVPVSIDQTFPVSTTVSMDLTVPVDIRVAETDLAGYIARLRATLQALEQVVSGAE
ncbi:MAG: hypothetical protein D6784_01920 [Chloroflexi bacterium]|nr:MAG: hypothetical protein D6784_01920 [Chloroflexota bacterium]